MHRIGMYAKTDLYPGQELFFDYGYNSKSTKFVPLEHNTQPKDTKVRIKLAGRTTKIKPKSKAPSVQRIRRIEDVEDTDEGGGSWTLEDESEETVSD